MLTKTGLRAGRFLVMIVLTLIFIRGSGKTVDGWDYYNHNGQDKTFLHCSKRLFTQSPSERTPPLNARSHRDYNSSFNFSVNLRKSVPVQVSNAIKG